MLRSRAAFSALSFERDAIAATVRSRPRCIAGTMRRVANIDTPRIPQRTIRSPSRRG